MQELTLNHEKGQDDELWLLEHSPVFTLGQNGKPEHLLAPTDIPVIQSDRGGQITYHGPGQLIAYLVADIKRLDLNVRSLVCALERSICSLLSEFNIEAIGSREAPGVYVQGEKICSIGLRVRKGVTYHGLALNINMDLKPFTLINPCGMAGLKMTQLNHYVPNITVDHIKPLLEKHLIQHLGYVTPEAKISNCC